MITEAHALALITQIKLLTKHLERVADALEHHNDLYAQAHFSSDDHASVEDDTTGVDQDAEGPDERY